MEAFPWDQVLAQTGPLGGLLLWSVWRLVRRLDQQDVALERIRMAVSLLPCRPPLPPGGASQETGSLPGPNGDPSAARPRLAAASCRVPVLGLAFVLAGASGCATMDAGRLSDSIKANLPAFGICVGRCALGYGQTVFRESQIPEIPPDCEISDPPLDGR